MASTGVASALAEVAARVAAAAAKRPPPAPPVRLVAVSKTKPLAAVAAAYEAGHRDFGENYVQELLDKAPAAPADIRWHFIGHLQSNKAKSLVDGVPNLACVETVDSPKLATKLDAAVSAALTAGLRPAAAGPLAVMVQVNTSGEASKHGVSPSDAPALALHVASACPSLRLAGLMTIGQPDYTSRPENFACLVETRAAIAQALGGVRGGGASGVSPPSSPLELSMGMSGDFEAAIAMGSTNVRVGSTIFGAREYA